MKIGEVEKCYVTIGKIIEKESPALIFALNVVDWMEEEGSWKAICQDINSEIELYDLINDEAEQNDVAAKYPGTVKYMKNILHTERTDSELWPLKRKK